MLKFWLNRVQMQTPWTDGGTVEVLMLDDQDLQGTPRGVPCAAITQQELAAKSVAMPGALLKDIAAAICSDKLGVTVSTMSPIA